MVNLFVSTIMTSPLNNQFIIWKMPIFFISALIMDLQIPSKNLIFPHTSP